MLATIETRSGAARFRFVSAVQALPYTVAFANGRRAGAPRTPATGFDSTNGGGDLAQGGKSASELRAFSKVASIAAVSQLGDAALAGLRDGRIIVTYTALRGFIERTAHTTRVAVALRPIKDAPIDRPLTPVLDLSEVIHKALYATQREWPKLIQSDFRKTSVKDVKYVKE